MRERALLIISLFRLDTSRRCGRHCWVCDWRHCEEIFWKTVNLIVPTRQVRGKRRDNRHFLIRLVKYNLYSKKKKKREKWSVSISTRESERGLEAWTSVYSMSRVLQPIRGVWSSGASLISPAVTLVHHFADAFFRAVQPPTPIPTPDQKKKKKCLRSKRIVVVEIARRNSIKKYGMSWGHRCTRLFAHVPSFFFFFSLVIRRQSAKFGFRVALTRRGRSHKWRFV